MKIANVDDTAREGVKENLARHEITTEEEAEEAIRAYQKSVLDGIKLLRSLPVRRRFGELHQEFEGKLAELLETNPYGDAEGDGKSYQPSGDMDKEERRMEPRVTEVTGQAVTPLISDLTFRLGNPTRVKGRK
jgi:hypothetical protein